MNELRIAEDGNKLYRATRVKSNLNSDRPWSLIGVVDEKGKNDITVFLRTPAEVPQNAQFKIKKIWSAKMGMKKGTDEKWRPQASIEADIEIVESDINFTDVSDAFGDMSFDEAINAEFELPL